MLTWSSPVEKLAFHLFAQSLPPSRFPLVAWLGLDGRRKRLWVERAEVFADIGGGI